MSRDDLNKLKWTRPFQPFRITTIDNEVFDIADPGLILVGKEDVTIGLPHPDKPPPRAKSLVWLGVEHIARVEPLAALT